MPTSYTLAELRQLIGQEIAVSDWISIPQDRIQTFADATGDHQWIHVDPERCRKESPFQKPIAHGFLTLSLLPMMMGTLCTPADAGLTLNYGLNKLRFPAPVPVDSRVRAHMTPLAMESLANCTQVVWQATIEREGGDKPVCVAELVIRHHLA